MLYRHNALKNLNSQEEFDKSIVIVPVKIWVAIIVGIALVVTAVLFALCTKIPRIETVDGLLLTKIGASSVYSPYEGVITECYLNIGQEVHKDDLLYVIKSSDGVEHEIYSDYDYEVYRINRVKGQITQVGDELLVLRNMEFPGVAEVVVAVPLTISKSLVDGMQVRISPTNIDSNTYGYIEGEIVHITNGFAQQSELMNELLGKQFGDYIESGYYALVYCVTTPDETSDNKFKWSKEAGKDINKITDQTPVSVGIVLGEYSPASILLNLKDNDNNHVLTDDKIDNSQNSNNDFDATNIDDINDITNTDNENKTSDNIGK